MGQRLSSLLGWIERLQEEKQVTLEEGWELMPVSGDASFRRYFRVVSGHMSWIAVDAPPEKENSESFVRIACAWRQAGVNVPEVIRVDLEQGFMLLEDFGDTLFLGALTAESVDSLYREALAELHLIQRCPEAGLPLYDKQLLLQEMALFRDWFVGDVMSLPLQKDESDLLDSMQDLLVANALAQPQVVVHRDYHARNLMICSRHTPGVIDFQDAVVGPVTYDLASLLRDCYIRWPDEDVYRWVASFRDELIQQGVLDTQVSYEQFVRWFDLMGMQRHLKAIGIFSRLSRRDNKHGYLLDIPRTLGYVVDVANKYAEFAPFSEWLKQRVLPELNQRPTLFGQSI